MTQWLRTPRMNAEVAFQGLLVKNGRLFLQFRATPIAVMETLRSPLLAIAHRRHAGRLE
jgi:hypothetical protein